MSHLLSHKNLALFCITAILAAGSVRYAYAQPTISVSTSPFTFADTMVGFSSTEVLRTITNTGNALLHFDSSLVGTNPADFTLGACFQSSLQPGQSCQVQVGFKPQAAGARSATLRIRSNDPSSKTIDIPLSGNATAPAPRISVSPATIDFGLQQFGAHSNPLRVTVMNTGAVQLNVSSVTINDPEFAFSQGCTQGPLGTPGFTDDQCAVDITFMPSSGGPRTGILQIVSDAGIKTVDLTGEGPAAALSITPANINFGSVQVGSSSTHRQIVVNNPGTAQLIVGAATISGLNAGDFVLNTPLPCAVQPGGSCSLDFAFSPHASGNRSGQVAISSSAPGSAPPPVSVTGFGEFIGPIPPPALSADDHHFVVSGSPGICSQSGQPITIPIPVTRVIGKMGTAAAVAAGTMSASATLEVMAFDTTSTGIHQLSMNGTAFGSSQASATGGWSLRTVTMPIGLLTFPSQPTPARAPAASPDPTPSVNTVVINPDAGQTGGCLAVAWARLSFLAMSPVILVHGNGSNGAFFVRRGFAPALDTAGIPEDSSINLAVGTGGAASIAANAAELQTLIPNVVKSFGVNSVHVVAHSKGGLDTRSWLSSFNTTNTAGTPTNPPFRVISLTTLSTPHRGSALADLEIAVDATSVGLFGLNVANLKSLGLGTPDTVDLTTFSNASFNPPLPSGADYRMLGADADLNGNGVIESAPVDEYLAARGENGTLAAIFASPPIVIGGQTITGPQIADTLVTTAYQILFKVSAVTVTKIAIPLPLPPFPPIPGLEFIPPLVIITVTVPTPIPGPASPNDILVTTRSALGAPAPFVSPFAPFIGPTGREHASVANGGVAGAVIPLLITTDVTRGDLK